MAKRKKSAVEQVLDVLLKLSVVAAIIAAILLARNYTPEFADKPMRQNPPVGDDNLAEGLGALVPETNAAAAKRNAAIRWDARKRAERHQALLSIDNDELRTVLSALWNTGTFKATAEKLPGEFGQRIEPRSKATAVLDELAGKPFGPLRNPADLETAAQVWRDLKEEAFFYDAEKTDREVVRFLQLMDLGAKRDPDQDAELQKLVERSKKPLSFLQPESTYAHYAWLRWAYRVVTGYEWRPPPLMVRDLGDALNIR